MDLHILNTINIFLFIFGTVDIVMANGCDFNSSVYGLSNVNDVMNDC